MSNPLAVALNSCTKFVLSGVAQPCLLCGGRSPAGLLCRPCAAELPRLGAECCPTCALPTPGGVVCGRCLRRPPPYARATAALRYEFPVDAMIQRLKYGGQSVIAGYLADALADALAGQGGPDLILAMPLHPLRLRQRGFNQAVLLAERLSRRLGIPVDAGACRRVRDTRPQVGLPVRERHKNIRHAFACDADLRGRRVALVDDVMTSGASLAELARVVARAGAVETSVWVVARAVHR